MIARLPNLNTILKRHRIHSKFWPEIRAFAEEGVRPSGEVLTRLRRVANYKAALKDILAELSKGLNHKFPPPDYQSPVSYESLRAEDIDPEVVEPNVLAGCAVRSPLDNQTPPHPGLASAHGARAR